LSYRLVSTIVGSTIVLIALVAGCSSTKHTPASPTSQPSKSSSASSSSKSSTATTSTEETTSASGPLDADACVAVTQANLDLAVANKPEDARKPADVLEKYDPPADVKAAIEHFVSTGGAQFDDPDFESNNKLIDDWVKEVCPL
jgi:hypothetical protein